VIASEEMNLMLNPAHDRFKDVRLVSKEPVTLDMRLYAVELSDRRRVKR
jgi:hypothetical protein